ncbi:ATP-binding protein [Magnetococcus sp. PR-3]|uniref:ATP-binding protein n=1 Tax=Magnetococcus sp. PR-3 TaxID=3120355 RepID=UPI002FCE353B
MRIFLKLFIGFWLTLLLMGGMTAWLAFQIRGDVENRFHDQMDQLAKARMELGHTLAFQGVEAFKDELEQHPMNPWIYAITSHKQDILERDIPHFVQRFILHRWKPEQAYKRYDATKIQAQTPALERIRLQEHPIPPPIIWYILSPKQQVYGLIVSPRRPHISHILKENRWVLFGIALYSLIAVLLLTLHFTGPIRRLKMAAVKLAEGDLQARCHPPGLRIPDELSLLVDHFNHMAERLEALFDGQKRLMIDISHELRSPLARMGVALELASRRPHDEKNLTIVTREMERLDRLIHEILTLSRPQAGTPMALEGLVDLHGLLTSIGQDVTLEGTPTGRRVTLTSPGELLVKANPEALHSAVENVMRNALRHTPEGHTVELTLRQHDQKAVITIRDFGKGVSEEALQKIFKPFFRMSEARERESGGYGLGLAIAQRIMGEHQGTIAAHNHEQGGLVVTLTLPLSPTA